MTILAPDRTRRRLAWRTLAVPLLLAAASAGTAPPARAHAAGPQALERRVKAAFLYKFLGYAHFPPSAFADAAVPLTIAVVGSDEMAAELGRIASGRLVGGRSITVRRVAENDALPPAHLLFVAGADSERAGRVLRAASSSLLTVTECELGLRHGSVINFLIVDERVRFDVSLDAADKKNVKLSSRLLTVANRVQKGGSW
ncbi:YfiR family protein [Massilia sp. H6]|uniref:YfiR family protein n=1 Tax=Massilia sp. H6 TaxID=2970464 RepID=UPI002168FA98|nr:YfiR family protein [Massilia sp. H6]UVW26863.1 YfiR family protein [Massilia sp. H6]